MMRYLVLMSIVLTFPTIQTHALGDPSTTIHIPEDLAREPDIEIDLSLETKPNSKVAPNLRITNRGNYPVTVADPEARLAVAFLVMDAYGNVVEPVGKAKVDTKRTTVEIGAKQSIYYKRDNLEFISGTALFGYDLSPGKTYRVVAIYRPKGIDTRGRSSREVVISIK